MENIILLVDLPQLCCGHMHLCTLSREFIIVVFLVKCMKQ